MRTSVVALLALSILGWGPPALAGERTGDSSYGTDPAAAARRALADTDVSVDVNEGIAVLTGSVALLQDKQHAEETVGEIPGIVGIDNRLKIDSHDRSDTAIRNELVQRVASDPALESDGIRIDVRYGRVVLSGNVPDARMRFEARKLAAETEGVTGVEDRLVSPAAPDAEIERQALALLEPGALPGPPGGSIGIDVSAGAVTLFGSAPTVDGRRLAAERVWGINGVRTVRNDVRVELASPSRVAEN